MKDPFFSRLIGVSTSLIFSKLSLYENECGTERNDVKNPLDVGIVILAESKTLLTRT